MEQRLYTFEELLTNPSFKNWVLDPDSDESHFWETYLQKFPAEKKLIARATEVIVALEATYKRPSDSAISSSWVELTKAMAASEATFVKNNLLHTIKSFPQKRLYLSGVAACIVLLISCWVGIMWVKEPEKVIYETAYGVVQEVLLPDSSVVVLNGNSKIEYTADWSEVSVREVWIEGEAYFEVREAEDVGGTSFNVYVDELTISVLGTSFNVRSRASGTQVVLHTGSIEMNHRTKEDSLRVKPGELVAYTDSFEKFEVDPRPYVSWKDHLWIFDQTSVWDIAQSIREIYGANIEIKGEKLAARQLSGEAVVYELDDLLMILESTFNIGVKRKSDSFLLFPKE